MHLRSSTYLVLGGRGVRRSEAGSGTGAARSHTITLQRLVILHVVLHLVQRVARRGALGPASHEGHRGYWDNQIKQVRVVVQQELGNWGGGFRKKLRRGDTGLSAVQCRLPAEWRARSSTAGLGEGGGRWVFSRVGKLLRKMERMGRREESLGRPTIPPANNLQ